jgi:pimeloyl-ACP methyl ester carboxylesterase
MPRLKRPDGVELHWEERGEGPLVVIANAYFNYPGYYRGLLDDLARDHRIVEYDLRGHGRSTRAGPYDLETDAEDLAALVEEAGPPAIVLSQGDGSMRAVTAAARHPDLISHVLVMGGTPIGPRRLVGTEGLMASQSVLDAILRMAETDPRSAFRTIIASVNPQLSEDEIRERVDRSVDYTPGDAGLARGRAWVTGDATDAARMLGDKLWMMDSGENPWIPFEAAHVRGRELLPEARIDEVADGPYSRPDLFTAAVRELTQGLRASHGDLHSAG